MISSATSDLRKIRAKWSVTAGRRGGMLIKGNMYGEPSDGLFPGFSASGQDVWVEEAEYSEPGIVVSAVGARCGKAFKADGKWTAIANTHVLLPRQGFDRDYLWWVFNSEDFWLKGGSAQPYVLFEDSLEKLIQVPSSTRLQQLIADYLDRETARLDGLMAAKERVLALMAEKRRALITRAVTRGLDPNAPLRVSDIPWLGQIPKHWAVIPLRYLVDVSGGATPNTGRSELWDGDIPWVSPKDMKCDEIEDAEDHVSELALSSSALRMIEPLSILIVVRGMILAHSFPTAISIRRVTINQDMKALHCRSAINPNYLNAFLRGYADHIVSLADASAHGTRKLESEVLGRLQVCVPPIAEQRAIVAHIAVETGKLDALRAATERTIALLKERRAALIAAAVTGKMCLLAQEVIK